MIANLFAMLIWCSIRLPPIGNERSLRALRSRLERFSKYSTLRAGTDKQAAKKCQQTWTFDIYFRHAFRLLTHAQRQPLTDASKTMQGQNLSNALFHHTFRSDILT